MLSTKEKIVFFYIVPIINSFFYINTNLLQNQIPADIIYAIFLMFISIYFFLFIYKRNNDIIIKNIFWFSLLSFIMGIYTYISHGYFDVKTIKIILANFFFVFGFFAVKTEKDFLYLLKGTFFTFCFFVLNIFIYNYFELGTKTAYNIDVDFSFGGQGINTVQLFPFFILSTLFFFNHKECKFIYKIIIIIIIIYSSFILFFSTKRGSILSVIVGFAYYIYKSKVNMKVLLVFVFLSIGMYILVYKYYYQIESIYQKRSERINVLFERESVETEGRYMELKMIINQFKLNPASLIMGNGIGSEYFIDGNKRMIHMDINMVFYSMGIIGLIIFVSFFLLLIKRLLFFKKHSAYKHKDKLILLANIMIINLIFIGLSGSLHVIQNRSYSLFVIGSVLGLLKTQAIKDHL